jgi:hypothetical protein
LPWYTEAAGVAKKLKSPFLKGHTPTTPKYVYGIQVANNLLYKFIKIVPIQLLLKLAKST